MMSDLTLHQMQTLHVQLVAKLIQYIFEQDYEATWGEAFRTPQQAQWDAQHGTGIAQSVHCDRLAVDLQLFKDGVYLTDPEAYKFAAEYWVSLHPLCRAGFFFKSRDSDHFSLFYQGRM